MALANLCFLCRCCQRCQNSRHRAFTSTTYCWSSARHISHYDVLGIKQDATSKEIKQAFFRKSKLLHPDSNPTNPELHSQFVKLNEAYNTLSKEKSRRDYDAQQTIQKTWQRQETHRGSARDPFGDLHIHRRPRNQKTQEHQSSRSRSAEEDPFNFDHFQETGRNPDPYGDNAYWQEFRKPPPEWYSNHEFKRRHQRNLRIVMYCLLIMSGSLLVHFVSYRQVAKLHTSFMDEKDRMITQALIKAKEQARARHEERLRQKRTPIPEEDPTSSKPPSENLDSVKDTVPPIATSK
ncbi:dnaJ homolog subfamily C member 4 [Ahaetulla prasina]|uniref:dnaJ homolog subfamily C member 4 n=1 Tax=Ahaetulla prasina TaxID=499056 RepID=UPI002647C035|nr:dnaJ homolog subfamily C member 4 [Ahaetulla prasina]